MKLGMNHPIGPLALSDLIGLDTVLHIMNVSNGGLKQEKYAPAPLLIQMVEEGKLGRKTGKVSTPSELNLVRRVCSRPREASPLFPLR